MNRLKRILTNAWTITIAGTMLGVLGAFFLDDWRERQHLKNVGNQMFEKVQDEITSNAELVGRNHEKLKKFSAAYTRIAEQKDGVVMEAGEMAGFQREYAGFMQVIDSTQVSNGVYNYSVSINLDIPNIKELSEFAWASAKESGIYSFVDFDCLYWFETTYGIQRKLSNEFDAVFETMSGAVAVNDLPSFLLRKIDLILGFEELLINRYRQVDERITACR